MTQHDCPFLDLAAELRNEIYELVLVSDDLICISNPQHDNETGPASLLYTCRQIRAEAAAIYYARNTFSGAVGRAPLNPPLATPLSTCVLTWLENVDPVSRRMIKRLELCWADAEACVELSRVYTQFVLSVPPLNEHMGSIATAHLAKFRRLGLKRSALRLSERPRPVVYVNRSSEYFLQAQWSYSMAELLGIDWRIDKDDENGEEYSWEDGDDDDDDDDDEDEDDAEEDDLEDDLEDGKE